MGRLSFELVLGFDFDLEFVRFKRIEFMPSRSKQFIEEGQICIATKSRNLGDALVLTTLPAKLKAKYPKLRITTYPRGFNPVVFYGNPSVSGISYLPDAVYGDDCNWGEGQLIQLKERYFDLPITQIAKPEIHLTQPEKDWISSFLKKKSLPANRDKPLCVIHPWGSTRNKVAPVEFWDALVAKWSSDYRFWQVGVEGHGAVQGCEYYFLFPPTLRNARRLFGLMSQAEAFIGVDSGPMHAARAFEVPSLILLNHVEPALALLNRTKGPYFLYENWRHCVLYEENQHAQPDPKAVDPFLETLRRKN